MTNIIQAAIQDLDEIMYIDSEVMGDTSRRSYIANAIELGCCISAREGDEVVGFLLYDTHFFDCSFISLLIVSPSKRRKGYASKMLDFMMRISPTAKVFSSTNRSNGSMQKVFAANGFIQSGIVENLDEGDPELIYFKAK
ncbi:GNAT family N-acetyltransferase [Peribacillus psychrosaccharolyticus]|uniref:GNAT family N-acetyltransferase n=1 Tax=Peribacillus psychrosaccharolyticus TaxID=1407 RepID=A0A974S0K0_PERPY|nr:GNAT family N-acetyltransferase [Peribacillus psychrosaccharolyticus]MEC2056258.1 GNAT family N-acetyltransferase [Peribacillus psychrosaccharolyticus]MED3743660.1 GNAT family N-acetyltransferase [Peribacillus psychrosaccharolyticus]QQT00566.1 GNAT family N-acetyltransferase [Peribacillus psychrosaccharolyticus]